MKKAQFADFLQNVKKLPFIEKSTKTIEIHLEAF